jgi:hypothetical protein
MAAAYRRPAMSSVDVEGPRAPHASTPIRSRALSAPPSTRANCLKRTPEVSIRVIVDGDVALDRHDQDAQAFPGFSEVIGEAPRDARHP